MRAKSGKLQSEYSISSSIKTILEMNESDKGKMI